MTMYNKEAQIPNYKIYSDYCRKQHKTIAIIKYRKEENHTYPMHIVGLSEVAVDPVDNV